MNKGQKGKTLQFWWSMETAGIRVPSSTLILYFVQYLSLWLMASVWDVRVEQMEEHGPQDKVSSKSLCQLLVRLSTGKRISVKNSLNK